MGRVDDIRIAPEGEAPMEPIDRVAAVADRGLRGDRYFRGSGYYSGVDGCQVTFVEAAALVTAREEYGVDLSDGRHRRNVVLSEVDVTALLGHRFRVGAAVFEGTRPRPPCAHLEELAGEEGVARALREERGGICADVIESGPVAVGDEASDLGPLFDGEGLVDAIRERREG
ncbi:MOSC domain-containing protein [Halobacteriales archaeon QS_5_70_17]|nr:MAG: MOSC domain-containing protein [Halobacteriales archaeon QS_5_70_17]